MKEIMMRIRNIILSLSFAMSVLLSGIIFAHAMLENSDPADGAVLQAAPKVITLKFAHPTKLTMLKLKGGDKKIPIKIELVTTASAKFMIPMPSLEKGSYQAKWAALSDDGHAMSGTLSFTISSGK